MDGIVIYALTDELRRLIGAKVSKIHQPGEYELVFQLRHESQNKKLLLSAHPTYARAQLTTRAFDNPLEPPMFCMLLRKYLEHAILEDVSQVTLERIIHLDFRHTDELGDLRRKRLIIELMGRHSNLILLDPEKQTILDGIRHITPAVSSYRVVMPGYPYVAPPQQIKLHLLQTTEQQWRLALGDRLDAEALVEHFLGFSPLLAQLVCADLSGQAELFNRLHQVKQLLIDRHWQPSTAIGQKHVLHVVPWSGPFLHERSFATVSEALEFYYGDRAERDSLRQRTLDLHRFIHNERAKNENKRFKLLETLAESDLADAYRMRGELLTASLHMVKRGDRSVKVINYYDEHQTELEIELDPQLTPAENAQRYFRKYTKLKNSIHVVREQLAYCQTEIDYFIQLATQLEHAGFPDLQEIHEELIAGGYMRRRTKAGKSKKQAAKPNVLTLQSSDGVTIWVGRNNLQNDTITTKLASKQDTWLHTKDIPGSHVVIHSVHVSPQTLKEAAHLAAYFSQARASSQVPVDYTLVRHVRKPSGAKPGFVIYEQQKTIYITPDESLLKSTFGL